MKVKHKERLKWNRLRTKVHWNNCEWHFVVRKHNQHTSHRHTDDCYDSLTVQMLRYEYSVEQSECIGAFVLGEKAWAEKLLRLNFTMAAKFNCKMCESLTMDERFEVFISMKLFHLFWCKFSTFTHSGTNLESRYDSNFFVWWKC